MEAPKKSQQAASCGTWVSSLTAAAATGSAVGLSNLSTDGDTLYWLEARPAEQGRSALVRRRADGVIEDITPKPVNVASRVHEYGGGAYAVSGGRIVYSEKSDGSVWLIEGNEAPRQIAGVKDCRYADFRFVPGTDDIVCVREDHRSRPPTAPEASIVLLKTGPETRVSHSASIDPSNNEGMVLVKGPDFLSSPRPSPDGKSLAWLSWSHPDMPWDATQLHVATLSPGGFKDTVTVAGADRREAVVQPDWSPGGTLYFCTDRSDWWNLHRLNAKGQVEAVTSVPDGEIGGPHWTFGTRYFEFLPDDGILASLCRNGQSRAARIDGGKVTDLGLPPAGQCPVVLPGANGKPGLAYLATSPEAQSFIGLRDGGSKSAALRSSGPTLLEPENISVGEEITFPTAGGEKAHAFYYPPVNAGFTPLNGEKPPLIVMIHGGPTSMAQTAFSPQKQWWTTRGFAVVDVNYRGSTGYGRPYRQKLDGNWGVTDVEDCIAAVKYLVADGRADPARVAIRGGSAGGFTVLAALTTSDIFKAGASHYGVGDLMLLAAETHKFEARYLDRLLGPLPQAADLYRDRSPINHLDKMAAGAIFFQGLDDKVVPPSQAATMVAAMHKLNLPVAHYEFEGEGHGFRKAETQRRVLELELGFYGRLFGFVPPGLSEKVDIAGMPEKNTPAKPASGKTGPA